MEYATVAWTQYLPPKKTNDIGFGFTLAAVSSDGPSWACPTLGMQDPDDEDTVPIWKLASADDAERAKARIGKLGEGQGVIFGTQDKGTGYGNDTSETSREGMTDDTFNVGATMETEQEVFETPYIDDITVTYFPPLEVPYWKRSLDPSE